MAPDPTESTPSQTPTTTDLDVADQQKPYNTPSPMVASPVDDPDGTKRAAPEFMDACCNARGCQYTDGCCDGGNCC